MINRLVNSPFFFFLTVLFLAAGPCAIGGASEHNAKITKLEFSGVDGEVLENIKRHVRLVSRLTSAVPLGDNERRRLQSRVKGEVLQALEPFGYYQARVVKEAGSADNVLVYNVLLNEPVTIRNIDLTLVGDIASKEMFVAWSDRYPLKKGDQLTHLTYESAKRDLQAIALRLGFFDAYYVESKVTIDENRQFADIVVSFDGGARYTVSHYDVQWQQTAAGVLAPASTAEQFNVENSLRPFEDTASKALINEDLLAVLIRIRANEFYDIDALTATQKALASTPYFAVVDVQPGVLNQQNSTVPVVIKLTPTKRKSYSFEVGVGTDTGIRGGVGYENRRVNSKGHNLSIRLGGSQIERSVNMNYRIPLTSKATDSFELFARKEQSDDVRDFDKSSAGALLWLGWDDSYLSFGLQASRETSFLISDNLEQQRLDTDLFMPSVGWQRTQIDDLYFPKKGWEASIKLRGASESLGSDIDLAQAIFSANALYPLASGRLKLRFKLASSLIDDAAILPESLGFLTGGDDSVRGYSFESIGVPRNGEITVAKNEIVGSVEYQHPLKNELALATFFDAGDAFNGNADYKRGLGIGLRWRLPFGALRLDLASALDVDGNPLRVHFGFGSHL